ncbi:hypothetical protein HZA38_01820 [Candidatus Peregrinibacteria bacterium]|nr:hypothetical protein [Candidatus Peregrinibacteria bacterium]
MKKTKSILRHELLNIFTLLQIELEEMKFSPSQKSRIQNLLSRAIILASHEDIFLGISPKFKLQKVLLNEFLEEVLLFHRKEIRKKKISTSFPKENVMVSLDRYFVREALERILEKVFLDGTSIAFLYNQKTKSLSLRSSKNIAAGNFQKPILECLFEKNISNEECEYQIALSLLEMYSQKVRFQKNEMRISLKKR